MFEVSIAMIYLKNKELIEADNSAQIFNILSTLPASLTDVDSLLKVSYSITKNAYEWNSPYHDSFFKSVFKTR